MLGCATTTAAPSIFSGPMRSASTAQSASTSEAAASAGEGEGDTQASPEFADADLAMRLKKKKDNEPAGPWTLRGGFAYKTIVDKNGRARVRKHVNAIGKPLYTATKKAGLIFPVMKFKSELRRATKHRTTPSSGVYMAAVLEYLTAEILELSGNCCRDFKKKRLLPRHILLAIGRDEELNKLVLRSGGAILPSCGVVPMIHSALLKHKKEKKKSEEDEQEQ